MFYYTATFTARWALIGIVLGLLAFAYNYNLAPHYTLPGYQFIAAPAMLALSFFSEELHFWPKMIIFIVGQYVGYFLLIFFITGYLQPFASKIVSPK